jgi:hypothetical protein
MTAANTIMTIVARTTAATMIVSWSTIPTAVITESKENTMSSRRICTITPAKEVAIGAERPVAFPASSLWWISRVLLPKRNSPPAKGLSLNLQHIFFMSVVAARIADTQTGVVTSLDKLTADHLSALLDEVLNDSTYRANARKLQKAIAKANGLSVAADLVEESLGVTRS